MNFSRTNCARRARRVHTHAANLMYYKDTVCLSDLELYEIENKLDKCRAIITRLADRVVKLEAHATAKAATLYTG